MHTQPKAKDEHQVAAQVERPGPDDHIGEQGRIVERHARRRVHDDLVDQQQQTDGRHQGGKRIGERNEPEADEIDEAADQPAGGGRQQEYENRGRLDDGEDQQAGICGPDGGRGIGEIDLVHHAENEREADTQQRIGGAKQYAVGGRLHGVDQIEKIHVASRDFVAVDEWIAARRRTVDAARRYAQTCIRWQACAGPASFRPWRAHRGRA